MPLWEGVWDGPSTGSNRKQQLLNENCADGELWDAKRSVTTTDDLWQSERCRSPFQAQNRFPTHVRKTHMNARAGCGDPLPSNEPSGHTAKV